MEAEQPIQAPQRIGSKDAALPLEVVIVTSEHEIYGIIHVSRDTREERRISDLLNDPERRFLAITDARLTPRVGPGAPRVYSFMQLHIDNIVMLHPSMQSVMRSADYSRDEAIRFDELRGKFNRTIAGQPLL